MKIHMKNRLSCDYKISFTKILTLFLLICTTPVNSITIDPPCDPTFGGDGKIPFELNWDGSIVFMDHDILSTHYGWGIPGAYTEDKNFLNNQNFWYRIGNLGPERPFSTLNWCAFRPDDDPGRVDVYYEEDNTMVWLPIYHVKAVSACGPSSKFPIGCANCDGVVCDKYPNGKDDPFESPSTGNDGFWYVTLSQDLRDPREVKIPAVIQGISTYLIGSISTGAGGETDKDDYVFCSRDNRYDTCGLIVPEWWWRAQQRWRNNGGGEAFQNFGSRGEVIDENSRYYPILENEDHADHAGNELLIPKERFKAKVSYLQWKRSAFWEQLWFEPQESWNRQINQVPESVNLELNLFKYNEVVMDLDEPNAEVDGYFVDVSTEHVTVETDPLVFYRINPNDAPTGVSGTVSGPGLSVPKVEGEQLSSSLFDSLPINSQTFPNYRSGYAWIWMWESIDIENILETDQHRPLVGVEFLVKVRPIQGDLNEDKCVDRTDLVLFLKEFRRLDPSLERFDLNNDGRVNIADARYLQTS